MSESTVPSPGAKDEGGQSGASAGELLKRAREATGMHIGTLAVTLKVPVKKLEALESDRWEQLPDAVFVRALAASVCRTLKVDPTEILEHLPFSAHKLMPNDAGINAPFRGSHGSGAASSATAHLLRPLGLAVIALIVGALGLFLWPGFERASVAPTTAGAEMAPSAGMPSSQAAPPIDAGATNLPASPASGQVPGVGGSSESQNAATAEPPMSVEARGPVVASAEPARLTPESPGLPAPIIVAFKTSGPSWIQVTDVKGNVVLKKLMGAGESATATGLLPLSVLVGRADVTTVEIAGKAFDLSAIARENVARFEVKP